MTYAYCFPYLALPHGAGILLPPNDEASMIMAI